METNEFWGLLYKKRMTNIEHYEWEKKKKISSINQIKVYHYGPDRTQISRILQEKKIDIFIFKFNKITI
jgi:hypothetical protein